MSRAAHLRATPLSHRFLPFFAHLLLLVIALTFSQKTPKLYLTPRSLGEVGLTAMAKETLSVNLLDSKEKGLIDTFLDWALYIGRLLIILTEAVALFVFVSRFSIDRTLVDLHDEVKVNETIVNAFKPREETFRRVHQKLSVAKASEEPTKKITNLFSDIVRIGSNDGIVFNNLSITRTKVEVTAQALTSDALATFVNKVKNIEQVASVSIEKVENRTSNAVIIITMTISLKEAGRETVPEGDTIQ